MTQIAPNLIDRRPIFGPAAPVDPDGTHRRVENCVAAKLEDIAGRGFGPVTSGEQAGIGEPYAWVEPHTCARCAAEAQAGIDGARGVAEKQDVTAERRGVPRDSLRGVEVHRDDARVAATELFRNLHEVRLTRQSGEMPHEDEDGLPALEARERKGRAVNRLEHHVFERRAGRHFSWMLQHPVAMHDRLAAVNRALAPLIYSGRMEASDQEQALVRSAAAGDAASFATLMRRHEGRVRATCARILGAAGSPDDCVQDAFTKAWKALPTFGERSSFGTWLDRIAANEALQAIRRRKPQEILVDELPDSFGAQTPGPGIDRLDRERVREIVRNRLFELPDALRVPVVLRDVHEWSNEEIAEALGVSLPAAKARIHRGRMRLRELLAVDLPDRG